MLGSGCLVVYLCVTFVDIIDTVLIWLFGFCFAFCELWSAFGLDFVFFPLVLYICLLFVLLVGVTFIDGL